jgi:hypothetical protein
MTGFRNLMTGAAGAAGAGGFAVDNSAVFNDDDSQYLIRENASSSTTGGADARKKFTVSLWWKHGNIPSGGQNLFIQRNSSANYMKCAIAGSGGNEGALQFFGVTLGTFSTGDTSAILRDPHAWYHILFYYDSTDSTAGDRARIYLNGTRLTDFQTSATNPSSGAITQFGSNNAIVIGQNQGASGYSDGYMAEMVVIDGQALTPSSFTETDSNGVLRPLDISSQSFTFGDQGFYLNFAASGSDLGDDASGNSNDFTNTNSVTQTSDSPTKNYAVLSPLTHQTNGSLSKGNTTTTTASADQGLSFSTFPVTTGQKVYIEALCSGATSCMTGCVKATSAVAQNPLSDFDALETADGGAGRLLHVGLGDVFNSDGNLSATNYAPNDSVPVRHMIALDLVNDKIYWGDAGVGASGWSNGSGSFNQTFDNAVGVDLTANLDWFFAFRPFQGTIEVNFGATAFTVSPPTGYSSGYSAAIENENRATALTIEDGSAYFQSTTYTGNGGSQSINQSGNSIFKPDLLWTKSRSGTGGHALFDIVRTTSSGQFLRADSTNAEANEAGFASFDSDGFSWDGAGTEIDVNGNTTTFVGWQWLADNTTGSSNSDGSITSTVSVNQTAGFSIVSYTGTGSNATVGHGLGAVPTWIVVKGRSASGKEWVNYHHKMGNNKVMWWNRDTAEDTSSNFQSTDPTSTVFSIGTGGDVNTSSVTYIAYCWCEKPGFSKFDSFEGNGNADGPFIETGFKPAWFLARPKGTASDWSIFDNGRSPENVMNASLATNSTAGDYTHSSAKMDFIANGIKIRGTFAPFNSSSQTIIYMAFAENPFAGTTPTTAR